MEAAARKLEETEVKSPSKISIIRQRCLKSRHANSSCSSCMDICKSGGIKLLDGVPAVYPFDCKECGACAAVCPTNAVQLAPLTEAWLNGELSKAASEPQPVISCAQASKGEAHVCLSCLGRLNVSHFLLMGALGAKEVLLKTSECKECPRFNPNYSVEKIREEAQTVLKEFGYQTVVQRKISAPKVNLSRRMMFGGIFKKATVAMDLPEANAKTALDSTPQAEEPWTRLPEQQVRKIQALRMSKNLKEDSPHSPFYVPVFNEKECVGCGLCVTSCPTGTLQKRNEEQLQIYSVLPMLCVGCRICSDSCYKHAVAVEHLGLKDPRLNGHPIELCRVTAPEDLLTASWEDKISKIFDGVPIYRT